MTDTENTERERASAETLDAERVLLTLIEQNPDVIADSPFLAVRTGLIAKLLALNEIYTQLLDVPGDFLELGAWYGQTSVVWENLRAIHEPFNRTRRFISVDTFSGYSESNGLEISPKEVEKYNAGMDWLGELEKIQKSHQSINGSGRAGTLFKNISGDILADDFWESCELSSPIALCYFDIATFDTTQVMLQKVLPMMATGGIVLLDDFGPTYPGVRDALNEAHVFTNFEVKHCKYFPSKLYFRV